MALLTEFGVATNVLLSSEMPKKPPFTTNYTLNAACRFIQQAPLDVPILTPRLIEIPSYADNGNFYGRIAEMHIEQVLDTFSKQESNRNICDMNAVDNVQTKNYRFTRHHGHLVAINRETNEIHAEYDGFGVFDGLPTIFEVKARQRADNGDSLNSAFRYKKQAHMLKPLREYFGKRPFGFVVITTPELLSSGLEREQSFIANGGTFISMNLTFEEIRRRSLQAKFMSREKLLRSYNGPK